MIYDESLEFNGMVISFPLTVYFKNSNPTYIGVYYTGIHIVYIKDLKHEWW